MQFLHQMFNVSALLLDTALKPPTPLTNGAINTVTVTQYLLKNVTNAQTLRNRTRNQTEYNYVYVCGKKSLNKFK